ncbi:type II secretion system minor pseudopilin GspK [Thermodesulfobacteriota bacterium]
MVKNLKDNRGVALILTILIISLLVILTLQFNTFMRSELYATENLRDGIKLRYIARSGLNYALAVLFEDRAENDFDSQHEIWSDSELLSTEASSLFEDYHLEISISDHSGRIQVNQLVDKNGKYNSTQKDLLIRLLNSEDFNTDPEEVEGIVDAIKDWIDGDNDVTEFGGAEDSYYQALETPYPCRNGPLESLEELLLIRGITRELFYGTNETPGISRLLTIYGNGRININTADPLVLVSLSDQIDRDMVLDMLSFREDEENDLKPGNWYRKVPGMSHISLYPDLVTTSSSYFKIMTKGMRDNMSEGCEGLVQRKEGGIRILSWEIL